MFVFYLHKKYAKYSSGWHRYLNCDAAILRIGKMMDLDDKDYQDIVNVNILRYIYVSFNNAKNFFLQKNLVFDLRNIFSTKMNFLLYSRWCLNKITCLLWLSIIIFKPTKYLDNESASVAHDGHLSIRTISKTNNGQNTYFAVVLANILNYEPDRVNLLLVISITMGLFYVSLMISLFFAIFILPLYNTHSKQHHF